MPEILRKTFPREHGSNIVQHKPDRSLETQTAFAGVAFVITGSLSRLADDAEITVNGELHKVFTRPDGKKCLAPMIVNPILGNTIHRRKSICGGTSKEALRRAKRK